MSRAALLVCLALCLAAAAAQQDCNSAACPNASSTTTCVYTCNCFTNSSVSRSFSCTGLKGAVGFLWTSASFPNGNSTYISEYTNDKGTFIYSDSAVNGSTPVLTPASDQVNVTSGNFTYEVLNTSVGANISFTAFAIPCVPQVTADPSKLSLTFSVDTTVGLTFEVLDSTTKAPAAGNITDKTFTATPSCGAIGSFVVLASIPVAPLGKSFACAQSSVVNSFPLSFTPSAPTNLAVNSLTVQSQTSVSLNASWTSPSSLGYCTLTQYFIQVTSPSGPTVNISLPPGSFSEQGSAVSSAFDVTSATPFETNVVYTINLHAVTAQGPSPAVSITFSLPAPAKQDCDLTLCPASSVSTTDCAYSCTCAVNTTIKNVHRSFTCSSLQGTPGFFWAVIGFPSGSSNVSAYYVNPTGATTPLVSGSFTDLNATNYPPITGTINSTVSFFNFTLADNVNVSDISFTTKAIACQATLTAVPEILSFSWTVAPSQDPMLQFQVLNSPSLTKATGVQEGNGFAAPYTCNTVGNYVVQSYVSAFGSNYTCSQNSNVVSFPLSFAPTAPSNLVITSVVALNSSALLLNATWSKPNLYGCALTSYFVEVLSPLGDKFNLTLRPGSFVELNETIAVGGTITNGGLPFDENVLYSISLQAITVMGVSPAVTADFAIPSSSLEDCDNTLCPPSSTSAVDCSYTCHCSVTKNISSVNRTFTCSALQGAYGFFWATLAFPNGNTFVDIHSVNAAGDEMDLIKASISNKDLTNYAPLTTQITETSSYFKYSLNKTDGVAANITFSTYAIPCQANVTVSPDTFTFTWTVSASADPALNFTLQDNAGQPVPASVGTITGQSFTAFPKCGGAANIKVVSSINPPFGGSYTCGAASPLASFPLSNPPSAPTNVVTSLAELLMDVNNNTDVRLNTTTWTVPAVDGYCNATEFNYFIVVSLDTTVFVNQLVTPAQYSTSGSTITFQQLKFSQFNKTAPLDTNAVYTLSVIAQSPAGASPAGFVTFTLPGYNAPSTSSSGLSNTVIAGIAVGATVGVIALALVIYKCSAARKGYQSIGDSNA